MHIPNIFLLAAFISMNVPSIQGNLSLSQRKTISKPMTDIQDMPMLSHDTELDSNEEIHHSGIILHSIQKRDDRSGDRKRKRKRKNRRQVTRTCKNNAAMVVIDKTYELKRPVKTYPAGEIIQGWGLSPYFKNCTLKHVTYQDDQFTVKTSGLYMIFSRITFKGTSKNITQYTVNIDEKTYLTCTDDVKFRSEENESEIGHHCNTIGVTYLKEKQQVSLRSAHPNWVLLIKDEDSYFGMTKLA